jgi:protein TonB
MAKPPSVPEEYIPPKAIKKVKLIYPQWAKDRGYQGEVSLKVQVFADGQVGEIRVEKSSGYEILDHSAIDAVKQWEFIPGREGNAPIWYWAIIPIRFQLK